MSSQGNRELLEGHLVAFFASRSVTSETERRCIAWAESICKTDYIVISGFHSPLEKKILKILLDHKHPVILFLGREIYKRIPDEYKLAIEEDRMLIESVRNYQRQSTNSSQIRNWHVADIANEIYLTPFDANSMLSSMYYHFTHYGGTPITIL